jgi:hypothetical protein
MVTGTEETEMRLEAMEVALEVKKLPVSDKRPAQRTGRSSGKISPPESLKSGEEVEAPKPGRSSGKRPPPEVPRPAMEKTEAETGPEAGRPSAERVQEGDVICEPSIGDAIHSVIRHGSQAHNINRITARLLTYRMQKLKIIGIAVRL